MSALSAGKGASIERGVGEAPVTLLTACAGAVVVMEDLTVYDALVLPPAWVDAPGSTPRPLALAFAHGQGRMVLQGCTLVVPCAVLEGALPALRVLPAVTVTPAAQQVGRALQVGGAMA